MNITKCVCVVGAGGVVGAVCFLGGCGHRVQRSPSLVKQAPVVEEKGFLERAGETTADVVMAPVRLVVPGKKPPKKEAEVYEPAETMIVTPWRPAKVEAAGTQPGQ